MATGEFNAEAVADVTAEAAAEAAESEAWPTGKDGRRDAEDRLATG